MGNYSLFCIKEECINRCEQYLNIYDDNILEDLNSIRSIIKIQRTVKKYLQSRKTTPNTLETGFYSYLKPGEDYDERNLKFDHTIEEIDSSLGRFIVDEKEVELFISYNKTLRKFCLKYPDQSIYIGTLNQEWKKEGYGVHIMSDKSKYEGFFIDNQKAIRGRFIGIDGTYYEG